MGSFNLIPFKLETLHEASVLVCAFT